MAKPEVKQITIAVKKTPPRRRILLKAVMSGSVEH
jgi:hypothetical protein